jgi:LysM repeat protein
MADRNLARVAAPLALLAALVAVVAVIAVSGAGSNTSRDTLLPPRTTATRPVSHVRATPKAYVVKAGDTLTVIADKTGVSLDEILQLNPEVDPNALQTGQRLKLTR